MPKVQPPELKKFMDKKLSSTCAAADMGARLALWCLPSHTAVKLPLSCCCCCCLCAVILNANRHVTGTLRGFDQFMNVVLDQTVDMKTKTDIGMVVSFSPAPGASHGLALQLAADERAVSSSLTAETLMGKADATGLLLS